MEASSACSISSVSSFSIPPQGGMERYRKYNIQRYMAAVVGMRRRELLTVDNSGTVLAQVVYCKVILEIMRLHQPSQE
jgi:hypothetical protein